MVANGFQLCCIAEWHIINNSPKEIRFRLLLLEVQSESLETLLHSFEHVAQPLEDDWVLQSTKQSGREVLKVDLNEWLDGSGLSAQDGNLE